MDGQTLGEIVMKIHYDDKRCEVIVNHATSNGWKISSLSYIPIGSKPFYAQKPKSQSFLNTNFFQAYSHDKTTDKHKHCCIKVT